MTRMLKGITVILVDETEESEDPFGQPVTVKEEIAVDNVLVAPASTDDVTAEMSLTGKKIVYELAIPKGDSHTWANRQVKFFGQTWRTVGIPQEGIESLIPLAWNRKVMVERYE